MISAFLPFVFSVVTGVTPTPAPAVAAAPEPAIRVTLNHQTYNRGDRARVTVRVRDDGYVVVLHADANGRVRVLFPVDPGDDNFMKGGQDYEIRGRGDRDAFQVTSTGSGTVYAAVSMDPLHFDDFVRNSHWDYERLESDSSSSNDAEAQLTSIVEQVADGSHFDYDLSTYTVDASYASNQRAYIVPGAGYDCFYDSWDPWCGGYYPSPSYYGGFDVGFGFGFGNFWGYRPYGYGYGYPRYGFGYGFGGGYYIPRGYGAAGYGYKVGRGWSYNHRPIILGPGGGYTVGRGFGVGAGLGATTVGYHNRGSSVVNARGSSSPLYGVSRFNTQRGSSRGIDSPNRSGRRDVSAGDQSGFRTRINDRPTSQVGGSRVAPRNDGQISRAPERAQPRGEARPTRVEPRSQPRSEPRGETRAQSHGGERSPQHGSSRGGGGGGGGGRRGGGGGGGGGGHHH